VCIDIAGFDRQQWIPCPNRLAADVQEAGTTERGLYVLVGHAAFLIALHGELNHRHRSVRELPRLLRVLHALFGFLVAFYAERRFRRLSIRAITEAVPGCSRAVARWAMRTRSSSRRRSTHGALAPPHRGSGDSRRPSVSHDLQSHDRSRREAGRWDGSGTKPVHPGDSKTDHTKPGRTFLFVRRRDTFGTEAGRFRDKDRPLTRARL
jgi:hypothetical protein